MLVLRLLSLLAGITIVVGAAPICILAGAAPQGEPSTSPWAIMLILFSVVLFLSAGYFLIGILGTKIRRFPKFQSFAGFLLLVPMVVCISAIVAFIDYLQVLIASSVLLGFSGLILSAFIWPGWLVHAKDR